ncbi:UNVERIFIED_CONTAM: hypothetical protein NY603_27950, partial [Bacteroidetes bacterium 56_B9]
EDHPMSDLYLSSFWLFMIAPYEILGQELIEIDWYLCGSLVCSCMHSGTTQLVCLAGTAGRQQVQEQHAQG